VNEHAKPPFPKEAKVELFRARRDQDDVPRVNDPEPPESIEDIGAPAAQVATVGIFVLLLGVCLYFSRPVLLPVAAALVIGMTLAPIVKGAARHRISPWLTAIALGALLLALAATAVTLLAQPVSQWIGRAPEIGATIKQKLYVLDRPLAALRELQEVVMPSGNTVAVESSQLAIVTPVLTFITPAVVQITLFFVTLIFFLATQIDFRR
jgi:predicted PurR-regulated permease PerM